MLLPRPHLTEKVLQSILAHSLTAVVAPLGYGKTILARALVERLAIMPDGSACYYAVPAGPHDGHFVWHDLCAAFAAQGLRIAPALRRTGLPETASQGRQALDSLRGLASSDTPVCLILDDYHHVADPRMEAFWERVARENIPNLHVALFSRTKPNVNLEDLRFKDHAALIEQHILAFSQKETEAFFRENGVRNPVAAAESHEFSEGWPVALRLCLQSWKNNGGIVRSGDIDSLLANSFYTGYSPEERDFLRRLCVLETFTDADAHRIAAAQDTFVNLRAVRDKNPFCSFDGTTGRWQLHSIFRDFLHKELELAHLDKASLYRLAGECCLDRRDLVAATRLFLRAGRDEDLSRLLDTFFLLEEDRNVFHFAKERFQAANAVPWRVRLQNPFGWLAVMHLYAVIWSNHHTAPLLEETEERFRTALEIPDSLKKRLQGEIEILRAILAFNDMDTVLRHYTEAVRLLNGPSRFVCEYSAWSFGSPNLSFICLREPGHYAGLLEKGAAIFRQHGVLSGKQTRNAKQLVDAEYLLERGDFSGAEPLFADTLSASRNKDKHLANALIAAFGLARLFSANGNPEKALPVLEDLRPQVEAMNSIQHCDCLDMALGYVNASLGTFDAIPRWLRDGEMFDPPHNALPNTFGLSLTIYAKALLPQGEYRRLRDVAKGIPDAAPPISLFARIHGTVLEALAAWHTRGQSEALELLREALELSRPDGIILPLAEYGGHILPLLRRVRQQGQEGHTEEQDAHLEAALALTQHIARLASPAKTHNGPLTPREQEIMRHVAKGATNPAIAELAHLSAAGVKYILGRVFAKLGASNRLEAAQRFVDLYGKTLH